MPIAIARGFQRWFAQFNHLLSTQRLLEDKMAKLGVAVILIVGMGQVGSGLQ